MNAKPLTPHASLPRTMTPWNRPYLGILRSLEGMDEILPSLLPPSTLQRLGDQQAAKALQRAMKEQFKTVNKVDYLGFCIPKTGIILAFWHLWDGPEVEF